MLDRLVDGARCPHCEGGFVEESSSSSGLTQAAQWLMNDEPSANSTEARIAILLDDLREHLTSVDGIQRNLARTVEVPATPKLEPAPHQVRSGITEVIMGSAETKEMRQTPQCVICCSDFEAGDELSQLPGCNHLFHKGCIDGWLDRAANCPICRCNLREAVGLERSEAASTSSSILLETDRSHSTASSSSSPSPTGTLYRGLLDAGALSLAQSAALFGSPPSSAAGYRGLPQEWSTAHSPDFADSSTGFGNSSRNWLYGDASRPRSRTATSREPAEATSQHQGSRGNRPLRLGTSSALLTAGSSITAALRRPSSVADHRPLRPPSVGRLLASPELRY